MGSSSSAREASAAARIASPGLVPSTRNGSPRVSLFCVNVPVLSEQSTSMPANSSIEAKGRHDGLVSERFRAPTAIVTDRTVGNATGTAATVNTKANCSVSIIGSPRKRRQSG